MRFITRSKILKSTVSVAAFAVLCAGMALAAEINYSVIANQPAGGLAQSWSGIITVNSLEVAANNGANILSITAFSGTNSYSIVSPIQVSTSFTSVSWLDAISQASGLKVESVGLAGFVDLGSRWSSLISTQSYIIDSQPTQWVQESAAVFAGSQGNIIFSTAVPEPTTYAMALAGLACGGYSMFRRRRAC